jgi:hypothetical protein
LVTLGLFENVLIQSRVAYSALHGGGRHSTVNPLDKGATIKLNNKGVIYGLYAG